MNPKDLLKTIRTRDNIFEISRRGNKKMWFSTHIPAELPVGDTAKTLKRITVPSYTGRYAKALGEVSGWLSWWVHTGPKLSSATAFIKILPHDEDGNQIILTHCEPIRDWEKSGDRVQFGLDSEWLASLMVGIAKGLESVYLNPLANVEVCILNTIVDSVDSDLNALELTGQWLMERLLIELYRRELVTDTGVS